MKPNFSYLVLAFFIAGPVFAKTVKTRLLPHEATPAEVSAVRDGARVYNGAAPDWKPVVDTTDFKYVLLSSEADFDEAAELRYTIARNLPEGVKLVLLVQSGDVENVKKEYAPYISADRIIFATAPNIANGFWARDAFPNPVVNAQGALSLVSAQYYRSFSGGPSIAGALNLNMTRNNFTFVGGNLLADENGNCFSVDSYRRFTITTDDFLNAYGCKQLHSLKHYGGIGDVDEVVKPLGGGVILTNTPQYAADFKSWGYNVVMLPDVPNSYRTYVNSLIVGKTVFMPTYGIRQDQDARQVYEGLGYKVVGITSNTLSDQMHGSVHCQSMAYPAMSQTQLLQMLNLTEAY